MDALSTSELATLSGVDHDTVATYVAAGILVPDDSGAFHPSDLARIHLVAGLIRTGLAFDRLSEAVQDGRLSFDYVDLLMPQPPRMSGPDEVGDAERAIEAAVQPVLGTNREPDEPIREDDLAILGIVVRAVELGAPPDRVIGILRSIAQSTNRLVELQRDFIDDVLLGPGLEETGDPIVVLERTSEPRREYRELGRRLIGHLLDRQTDDAVFRNLVQMTEHALAVGGVEPDGPEDTIVFIDVSSYTALSERHGDREAARQAVLLADFVHDLAERHGARLVRSLGDGALVHAPSVEAGLDVGLDAVVGPQPPGLWRLHAGINTGPMVRRGGDFYGSAVNIAARVADEAAAGEIVVTQAVVDACDGAEVRFTALGETTLKNVAAPVAIFRASRGSADDEEAASGPDPSS